MADTEEDQAQQEEGANVPAAQEESQGDVPPLLQKFVSRDEWGALGALEKEPLTTPVSNIICTYTGTEPCTTSEECQKTIKELQHFHMETQKMPDIIYNFLVGGDGKVYEGRGWTTYAPPALKGKRYNGLNYKSINVALVGDYKDADPPDIMVKARKDLIDYGKDNNYIDQKTAAMWHGF